MPVTKTAKRALRVSKRLTLQNKVITSNLEVAIRKAKKSHSSEVIRKAISLADRAAKKHAIHKNKANRIKSTLAKLLPKKKAVSKTHKISKKK